ncbi:MAG TPA: hypothetical protein VI729_13070 [Anaerolineales bacterium]|nr:hypothetical protein [Anaerolineales bacterium]
MNAQASAPSDFRWRSPLGLAVALFLFYGGANVVAAVSVPLSLHTNGPGAAGVPLILDVKTDSAMLGTPLPQLREAQPRLSAFLVGFMDSMCAYMMAFAIVFLAVTWFAPRNRLEWAMWTLLLGTLAILPYYALIAATYSSFDVAAASAVAPILFSLAIGVAATALAWVGLRAHKPPHPPGSRHAA